MSVNPKHRLSEFCGKLSYFINIYDAIPPKYALVFTQDIIAKYDGRYSANGDEVVIKKDIPLSEAKGIASLTDTIWGLVYDYHNCDKKYSTANWLIRLDKKAKKSLRKSMGH